MQSVVKDAERDREVIEQVKINGTTIKDAKAVVPNVGKD